MQTLSLSVSASAEVKGDSSGNTALPGGSAFPCSVLRGELRAAPDPRRQEGSRGGSAVQGLEGGSGQISQNLLEPGPRAQALMSGSQEV